MGFCRMLTGETKIARLELLMILHGLLCFPSIFLQTTGIWFVENIAALMALIKARSESPELDIMAQSVHLFLFHLRASLWFEWVPSQSRWSDEISRKGLRDKWHQDHHFRTHTSTVPCYQGCFGVWRAADSFAKSCLHVEDAAETSRFLLLA